MHHVVFPSSVAAPLRQVIADAREMLADYAIALCSRAEIAPIRAKLLSQAITIENLRASAIFEDREIRVRGDAFRALNTELTEALSVGRLREALGAYGISARQPRSGSAWRSPTLNHV